MIGFVYLAEATALGMVKIGHSRRPSDRARALSTAEKTPVKIWRAKIGNRIDESRTLRLFSSYRVRGEWFFDVPEIRDFFRSDHHIVDDHNQHMRAFWDARAKAKIAARIEAEKAKAA